jgi:hypothetical protein
MKSLKIIVFIYIKTASKVILDAVFFITYDQVNYLADEARTHYYKPL